MYVLYIKHANLEDKLKPVRNSLISMIGILRLHDLSPHSWILSGYPQGYGWVTPDLGRSLCTVHSTIPT